MGNRLFEAAITKKAHEKTRQTYREEPREPGLDLWVTEVRTSIQVSHLYLRAPSGCACLTASECGRQAGAEDAFGVFTGIFPSLQGLRPLRRYAAIP